MLPQFRIFVLTLLLIVGLSLSLKASTAPPPEGGVLPDIRLEVPPDPIHRDYLGLKGQGPFAIPDIRAEVVIIEIFSMY